MVMFSMGTSPFAFSEEDHASEQKVEKVEKLEKVAKPEDKVVTRQQALITGMKELNIPRFQLERIAQLLENNPKTTSEQFSKLIDLTNETIPGFLTKTQVEKLKKLYKDELGQVKAEPATEFVSAAKVVASKLPIKPGPETPPANPDIPSDPKNAISTLSGATITPPGSGRADSFPDISGLGKSSEGAKGLKALEERVATLQDSLARQQLAGAIKAGENGGQDGKKGGLAEQLLGLLRKEDGGRDGRGRNRDDRGDRNRDREAQHAPAPSKNDSDDSRDRKSDSELSKRGNERDNNRDRQRGNPPQQPANNEKKDGQGKDDGKKGDDKDKKAEPIIQAGELSKEKKEPKAKEPEKNEPEVKADDSLANAAEVLTGKPKMKVSLGQGKTAEAIPASNQVSSAAAAGAAQESAKENNAASSPPVVGGPKGGGEGGGSGLGETPSATGETGSSGGGGGGGQTYNFIRLTEFMAASGGDSAPDTNANGYFDETPATPARRPGVPLGSETLHIGPATETAKGWLLDVVYNWRKKICDGPDRNKVAWCFNLPKKVAGRASEPLIIRSGIQ